MTTLGAYIIVRNEQDMLPGCVNRLLDFCHEILIIDHGSTDGTWSLVQQLRNENPEVIRINQIKYEEPIDMGKLRTMCYQVLKSDWVLNVDADEWYPAESMREITLAIENPGEAISFRVPYFNLAWRPGYVQDKFEHYPDRVYRRDCVEAVVGLLPNDMHHVKKEFYQFRPILEYDNAGDQSFENPKQPILHNAPYYHLARTRGYNFEFSKWMKYNRNLHPKELPDSLIETTKINQWVSGLYPMRLHDTPKGIPLRNMPKPTVSVVIPNFQYAQYVGEAIQSALDQTYPVLEVIVVDDGSYDKSVEVINEWVKKDKRVHLRQQKNMGVATARNGGIAQSIGDFFICLDADDKLDPTYVEKTVARALSTNAEVVYTDLRFFQAQTGDWTAPEPTIENMRQWQIVPSTCALVERHCFDACGGFNHTTIYEDWDFWCNLMIKQSFTFAHFSEPLFLYRKHGPSRINELDKQQALGFWQLKQEYGVTREPDK